MYSVYRKNKCLKRTRRLHLQKLAFSRFLKFVIFCVCFVFFLFYYLFAHNGPYTHTQTLYYTANKL